MPESYGFQYFEGRSFSELYAGDTAGGGYAFMLSYPTTANWSLFPNTRKYFIQDGNKEENKVGFGIIRQLEPWRMMATLGETLPGVLVTRPPQGLIDYWKDHSGYSYNNLVHASPKDWAATLNNHKEYNKIITLFPLDYLLPERHAVDPDDHYYLLGKHSLPKMSDRVPDTKVYDLSATPLETIFLPEYPFVVKTSHGLSGEGTYIIQNDVDLAHCLQNIRAYQGQKLLKHIIVMDFVPNAKENYCVQFYVSRKGKVSLIGATSQLVTKKGAYLGGLIHYRDMDMSKFFPIIDSVAKYVSLNGYFGVVGVDVMEDRLEELHVIDVNVRVNGSTPLCLHRSMLLAMGKECAKYSTRYRCDGTLEEIMHTLKPELERKDFIILSALEHKTGGSVWTQIYGISTGENVHEVLHVDGELAKKGLVLSN